MIDRNAWTVPSEICQRRIPRRNCRNVLTEGSLSKHLAQDSEACRDPRSQDVRGTTETEPPPSNEEGGPSLAHNTGPSLSHTLHTEPPGRRMLEETNSPARTDKGYSSSRLQESRPTSNVVKRSLEIGAKPGTTVAHTEH